MFGLLNKEVDLKIKATSYFGVASYGYAYVGNNGFEYYNEKNIQDFIQIPWAEVDYISASVLLGGRWISRFAIFTKKNGYFTFSTKDNKKTLRAISKYISKDKMLKSPSFMQVVIRGIKNLIWKK